ncbi:MAG: 4-(cytidine 5'-diphospho)-2-C-methyl-D-erythritol kinase [Eubacteriales bacterium]|nr:4-(cytidine 5'-diphospho)-2-C-methyl-D-erythritol kinase [Eubacteriales bacterium]
MFTLHARAKINWSLDILGRQANGYHRMDMLMSSVELGDELTIEPSDDLSLTIIGGDGLPETDNLVLKAARALRDVTGCKEGAHFTLKKLAPVGAGMGGGSADAAAALIGLNRLWQTNLSQNKIFGLGLSIGADVPFLLSGGFARVGGIGEEIEPLPPLPALPLVIVQPCKALSTREVFTDFDSLTSVAHPHTDGAQDALKALDYSRLSVTAGNVLYQAIEAKRPQITEAIAALTACGAAFATMTGSGSAVFGAFSTEAEAQTAFRTLRKRWRKCWLTRVAKEGVSLL